MFYHDLDVISWDSGAYGVEFDAGTTQVGNLRQWGVELELLYRKKPWRAMLSHGYTKLLDFKRNPDTNTVLTAQPYGYGDDLANWSNHVTKLVVGYDLNDQWRLDGSARVYWGYPGAEDFAQFVTDHQGPISIAPGYDDPYGPSVFFNLGLQYRATDHLTMRVDGYNLLGWFDDDLNKRLYGFNSYGDYRAQAPALSISLHYLLK
ncbi:MAG: TonB-dependent receptor [Candidatus Competibacteraceae bacterium]|nr:TonB-dependent receptor [Candidatus Competibacteraceae bacterium]